MRFFRKKLKQPQQLSEALEKFLPRKVVRDAACHYTPGELIDVLSDDWAYPRQKLLEQVAASYGILAAGQLVCPTKQFLDVVGYDVALLRQMHILPQGSEKQHVIVVCDPTVISVADFKRQNIEVSLSTRTEIERIWALFDQLKLEAVNVSETQVIEILQNLAFDAKEYGAESVCIGERTPNQYSLRANGKRYSGTIHPGVYRKLETNFRFTRKITLKEKHTAVGRIAIVPNEEGGFSMFWRGSADVEETPSVETKTSVETDSQKTLLNRVNRVCSRNGLILLVDDDARFCLVLQSILSKHGHEVIVVGNGRRAMEVLGTKGRCVDLVICDLHMPEMDGSVFLERCKEQCRDMPIIMLTSDDTHLLQAELLLLGADAFIRKQDDPRILLAWVNNLLGKRQTSGVCCDSSTEECTESPLLQ